jgi:hypothetical protein
VAGLARQQRSHFTHLCRSRRRGNCCNAQVGHQPDKLELRKCDNRNFLSYSKRYDYQHRQCQCDRFANQLERGWLFHDGRRRTCHTHSVAEPHTDRAVQSHDGRRRERQHLDCRATQAVHLQRSPCRGRLLPRSSIRWRWLGTRVLQQCPGTTFTAARLAGVRTQRLTRRWLRYSITLI